MNIMKNLFLPEQLTFNRNLYKSIVVGMSICIPLGIGFGIAMESISLGLISGNSFGVLLGIGINWGKGRKDDN